MNNYHCHDQFSKFVDVQQGTSGFETLTNRFLELAEYLYKELSSRENFGLVCDDDVTMDEWNIFLISALYLLSFVSHILSILC